MPGSRTGKAYKLSRPYHGPYRVVTALDCGVNVCPVDKPNATPILWHTIALDIAQQRYQIPFGHRRHLPMERRPTKLQTTPLRPSGLVASGRDLPPGQGRPDAQEGRCRTVLC